MKKEKEGFDRGKIALIYIYYILRDDSDYNHPLTQQNIIEKLEDKYNITMERKAVKRNLTVLEEAGVEIDYLAKGCYLSGRSFMDSEIRMLIDSVLSCKHITAKDSKSLIERLANQSNQFFQPHIKHVRMLDEWDKTDNEALFDYSLESIPAAGWKLIYVSRDLHAEDVPNVMTEYEEKFSSRGNPIYKLIACR